jgi:hypothetical protein
MRAVTVLANELTSTCYGSAIASSYMRAALPAGVTDPWSSALRDDERHRRKQVIEQHGNLADHDHSDRNLSRWPLAARRHVRSMLACPGEHRAAALAGG